MRRYVATAAARTRALGIAALLLLASPAVHADSWLPPRQHQVVSADGRARVTVTPRPLAGALPYFRDKVDGKEPAGQQEGSGQATPVAMLERQDAEGRWQVAWQGPLVNDVAPVGVLVAGSGRLVTFDNWHSMGYGDDVVVIYDERGKLVRKLALADFLPAGYIASLPRSVSSLYWSAAQALVDAEQTLELQLLAPGTEFEDNDQSTTVPLRIGMADGQPLARQDARWTQALERVAVLEAERRVRWEALRARRAAPLAAPQGSDTQAWRDYMVELRERLNQALDAAHAGAVLPARGKGKYPDSADAIARMIGSADGDGPGYGITHLLFVSPRPDALARLLADTLRELEPGSLAGVHVSIVGSAAHADTLQPLAARTGASIHLIDQATPYPGQQLPDEMPAWFD